MQKSKENSYNRGFALISTINLVALLAFVAIALLSLSIINSRSKSSSKNKELAEGNAKLALYEAIGQLQLKAGHDTRITAPATAVIDNVSPANHADTSLSPVTGVWRSWEGSDHDATGLPQKPNYAEKLNTGDPDGVVSSNSGRFLGWLVNGDQAENDADSPPDLSSGSVSLLDEGTLGSGAENDEIVRIDPTSIDGGGSYAWWVQGENTKANLDKPPADPSSEEEWSERQASFGHASVESFGLNPDSSNPLFPDSFPSTNSINILDPNFTNTYFHDATHYAYGLLTNSATGGWKKDLSLMSESYPGITDRDFFTVTPGDDLSYNSGELVYHWANNAYSYLNESSNPVSNTSPGGASSSWDAIVEFSQQYKDIQNSGSLGTEAPSFNLERDTTNGKDGIMRRPILARIHWVYSFQSLDNDDGTFNAQIVIQPVLTYWNPYNITIPGWESGHWVRNSTPSPYEFEFDVAGTKTTRGQLANDKNEGEGVNRGQVLVGRNSFTYRMPADNEEWEPGETRIYSATNVSGNGVTTMVRGFIEGGGDVNNLGLSGAENDPFTVELFLPARPELRLLSWIGTSGSGTRDDDGENVFEGFDCRYVADSTLAQAAWGDGLVVTNTDKTLGSVAGAPSPFLVSILQLKTIPNAMVQALPGVLTGRGYSNNKPLINHLSNGGSETDTGQHPESLAYDWIMLPSNGVNSNVLPQGGLITEPRQNGFIGTDFQASIGLTGMVVAEIPSKPLRSIGELQHFDIAAYNPSPPFIMNPIGNSNANYLIGSESLFVDNSKAISNQDAYDHSYISNHLLLDDWFVSSLNSNTGSLDSMYSDFLDGSTDELPNDMYKLSEVIPSPPSIDANTTWKDFASHLQVKGMFNVNSTSVEAWKAMLKNLRGASVQKIEGTSVSLESSSSGEESPVARTTISGPDDSIIQLNTDIASFNHVCDAIEATLALS